MFEVGDQVEVLPAENSVFSGATGIVTKKYDNHSGEECYSVKFDKTIRYHEDWLFSEKRLKLLSSKHPEYDIWDQAQDDLPDELVRGVAHDGPSSGLNAQRDASGGL